MGLIVVLAALGVLVWSAVDTRARRTPQPAGGFTVPGPHSEAPPLSAVLASALGATSLVVWFLGPVAVLAGVWALATSRGTAGPGRGRAVFGVVVGGVTSLFFVALMTAFASDSTA